MRSNYPVAMISVLCLLISSSISAQYYYKEIWNSQQLNREFVILKNQKIRNIAVKSFESDGQPSEGFFCEKRIDKNYGRIQMFSKSNVTGQSLIFSYFNPDGRITRTVDSTEHSFNQTEYVYDESGRITTIKTFTKDDADAAGISETHKYTYAGEKLVKMESEKNNAAFATVNFKIDDKGNVIEEEEVAKNNRKKYFYYYDDKNQLTDVVHYNDRAKRLLPDYMYEYDELGQVSKLVSTEADGTNYFTWIYTYNDQHLRVSEKCSAKDRRLLGSVEYVYK
ncbi:MAG: hypothetical protein ABJA57_08260 [Ginsengibacter sp.]